MKSLVALSVVVLAMSMSAEAGLLNPIFDGPGAKCCDCAPGFYPSPCRPRTGQSVFHRLIGRRCCSKPVGCDGVPCDGRTCCPVQRNAACRSTMQCGAAECCSAVRGNGCCVDPGCAAPCNNGNCNAVACTTDAGTCIADPGCAAPCTPNCNSGSCCTTCCDDPCTISQLILESQTACYVMQRRNALRKLGRYNCMCHPEIIAAFVYALNDCDSRVRMKAADELGDQLRQHRCCCSPAVVAALQHAECDCNLLVRIEARQALWLCQHHARCACDTACTGEMCCNANACCSSVVPEAPEQPAAPESAAPQYAPAPMDDPTRTSAPVEADAPAPVAMSEEQSIRTSRSLRNLFGMLN